MNKTKAMKLLITLLCFGIMLTLTATVFAGDDGWVEVTVDRTGTDGVQTIGGKVVGVLQVVGMVISVIVLMILGIKYMMGSAEEKAEYKKTFIPYIIGAVLVFGASALAKTLYNMIGNMGSAAGA